MPMRCRQIAMFASASRQAPFPLSCHPDAALPALASAGPNPTHSFAATTATITCSAPIAAPEWWAAAANPVSCRQWRPIAGPRRPNHPRRRPQPQQGLQARRRRRRPSSRAPPRPSPSGARTRPAPRQRAATATHPRSGRSLRGCKARVWCPMTRCKRPRWSTFSLLRPPWRRRSACVKSARSGSRRRRPLTRRQR